MATSSSAGKMFTLTVEGESKTYYESEREAVNEGLNARSRAAIAASAAEANAARESIEAQCPSEDALRAVPQAIMEFARGFREPMMAPVDDETLVETQKLLLAAADTRRRGEDVEGDATAAGAGTRGLTSLREHIFLGREVRERGDEVGAALGRFLDDPEFANDVAVPLHQSAFANDFAFARAEIDKLNKQRAPLDADLERIVGAREDAESIGDADAAEQLHYHEIEVREKLLKLARDLADAAGATAIDAQEFYANIETLREQSQNRVVKFDDLLRDLETGLTTDMERAQQLMQAETDRHKELEAAEHREHADLESNVAGLVKNRVAIWEQIRELLQRDAAAVKELETARIAVHEHQIRTSRREAEFRAFADGLLAYSERLDRVREHLLAGRKLKSETDDYLRHINQVIDAKGLAETSQRMRHEQQLAYLAQYTTYGSVVGDLVHRKETRMTALRRAARNLELQIHESHHLLDPNRRKYEADKAEAEATRDHLGKDVDGLRERAARERDLWKPVEDALEEDDVDFEPPDLVAERQLCERREKSLAVAREYVVTEQEHVDKDTLALRKIKMAAKVSDADFAERRALKLQSNAEDEARADGSPTPPTPPPAAA